MEANGIPTARYGSFTELEPALAYVHELGAPVVVKADGLAAGKGVVVADTIEVAEDAVRSCFDGAFGSAGSKVVVEECLTGPECSLLAFVSGGKAHCMATAQDHKRDVYKRQRLPSSLAVFCSVGKKPAANATPTSPITPNGRERCSCLLYTSVSRAAPGKVQRQPSCNVG